MHDVAIVVVQVLDGRRLRFVGEEEDAGPVAPENAVPHGDAAHGSIGPVEVPQSLERDAVVVGADEAIVDEHVLRVAGIDAIVVLHPAAQDLDVADQPRSCTASARRSRQTIRG